MEIILQYGLHEDLLDGLYLKLHKHKLILFCKQASTVIFALLLKYANYYECIKWNN